MNNNWEKKNINGSNLGFPEPLFQEKTFTRKGVDILICLLSQLPQINMKRQQSGLPSLQA